MRNSSGRFIERHDVESGTAIGDLIARRYVEIAGKEKILAVCCQFVAQHIAQQFQMFQRGCHAGQEWNRRGAGIDYRHYLIQLDFRRAFFIGHGSLELERNLTPEGEAASAFGRTLENRAEQASFSIEIGQRGIGDGSHDKLLVIDCTENRRF
jgi:hypothetical protein